MVPCSSDYKFYLQVYELEVQCNAPVQVSLELKAISPVSSMGQNVSNYAGGRCKLTLAVNDVFGDTKSRST